MPRTGTDWPATSGGDKVGPKRIADKDARGSAISATLKHAGYVHDYKGFTLTR